MKNDKEAIELEQICEAFYGGVYSPRPILSDISFQGRVRITRTSSGWNVEIYDDGKDAFVPANEYLSDIALKRHSSDVETAKGVFSNIQKKLNLKKSDIGGIEKTGQI